MPVAIKITVAETLGSTPRDAGTEMLVFPDRTEGTIGGGALEWRAIERAREMLDDGISWQTIDLPLGPALEQCCGGHVRLELKACDDAPLPASPPLLNLSIYGAGHVGQAVVKALDPLPVAISWHDTRMDQFPQPLPLSVSTSSSMQPPNEPGGFHLVMTHSHALDLDIVAAVLGTQTFGWLGLIGSATKRVRFERALKARGIPAALIERIVCPIGIAGIRSKSPAIIAASVTAQLLIAAEAYSGSSRNKQLVTAPE